MPTNLLPPKPDGAVVGGWNGDRQRRLKSDGAVAQLVEHLLCKQDVIGSIPFSSTIILEASPRDAL
jgi:hypothetical protein